MAITFDDRVRERARLVLDSDIVARIWRKDPAVWAPDDATEGPVARAIANRLGWLETPDAMREHVDRLSTFASEVHRSGVDTVYLLGMGGSSLCAEVLRMAGGIKPGSPEMRVLDTTDEQTIREAAAQMNADRTLFLVSSKSGGTVEVNALEHFFVQEVRDAGVLTPGAHFVAITDPGTPLEHLAAQRDFREVFINPPDIGGRFSALSLFGLVPAAIMGIDLDALLQSGSTMAEGCRQESAMNPGLALGVAMALGAEEGRDKLTVLLPPSLESLGLWIEQLVAESTGKHGRGILPVVREPIGSADHYGNDRLFVVIDTEDDRVAADEVKALEAAGHPVVRLTMRHSALGAEFFRWEFAVAVAGAILAINPFDEPNVKEAKDRTSELIATFTRDGRLPEEPCIAADGDIAVYGSDRQTDTGTTPAARLRSLLGTMQPGDYLALLSYLPPDIVASDVLQAIRTRCRDALVAATTVGTGPRYLHSTGQYHKGGPDTGVFVIVTTDDPTETTVPGMPYSFSVLKRAQALGDFQALQAHARRVLRVHISGADGDAAAGLGRLFDSVVSRIEGGPSHVR